MSRKILVGKAIKFNPAESIKKGSITKKVPMGLLTEFQRKINGYEYSEYNSGPKFRNGDTIFAKITPCLENGKTAFVDILEDGEVAFGSSEFIVLRKTNFTESQFIYYFARSPLFRDRAIRCMEGTSGRKRVNENTLKNLEFVFPDIPTQKAIAKVLSDLDAKIELNNKINQELEAMAKTLYDYWFVQFDFPNAEGKPYKSSGGKMVYNAELKREIPEGWEMRHLSKITSVSNESINPMLSPDKDYKHYSIPTYDATNTYGIEKGKDIRSNKFTVSKSDVLVSKLNPWFSRVINPIEEDDMICSTEFVVWRTPNINIKNYLFMVATGEHFISYCTQSATGTSNSHKRVNPTVMMRYKVSYNADLVQKYGATIHPLLKNITSNRIENQHLIALRDWLLPMLMNGQVTVKEA